MAMNQRDLQTALRCAAENSYDLCFRRVSHLERFESRFAKILREESVNKTVLLLP